MDRQKGHGIIVTLTQAAQRKALLDGQPAEREQTYTLTDDGPDLPRREQLRRLLALPWTTISPEGVARCHLREYAYYTESDVKAPLEQAPPVPRDGFGYGNVSTCADERPCDVLAAIEHAERVLECFHRKALQARAAHHEQQAQIVRMKQEAAARWAAYPLHARARDGQVRRFFAEGTLSASGGEEISSSTLMEYAEEAYEEALAEAQRQRDEADRIKTEEAHRTELAAREEIEALLAAHGTESMRQRFAAKLLPEDELADALQTAWFAPFATLAQYVPLCRADVPCWAAAHGRDKRSPYVSREADYRHKINFHLDVAEELTDTEWQAYRKISEVVRNVEGASYTLQEHSGVCAEANCAPPNDRAIRRSVLVTIARGSFRFSREFALSGKEELA